MVTVLLVIMTGCGGGNSTKTNVPTDVEVPVITLNGQNPQYSVMGSEYIDEGATANDSQDGVLDLNITGEVDTSTVGTYEITYIAEDKSGNKTTAIRKVIVEDITHNGVSYGILVSSVTGRIWLDRNLGAAEPCDDNVDNNDACEGDFYQWGRNADGHEDSMSPTRTTKIDGLESSDGKFVVANVDWSNSMHRGANWSKVDGSSVCPVGFRVPMIEEFEAEVGSDYSTELKFLQVEGSRHRDIFGNYYESERGGLWSISVSGETFNDYNYFTGPGSYVFSIDFEERGARFRVNGYNVRCLKP